MSFLRRRRKDRPVQLSTKPAFPVSEDLARRQKAAREVVLADGKNIDRSIKRLILEEDTFVDLEELPIG